ncbi:50S ribosomal protein L24 [Camellia lanceoleosa]|uniref:50S ribosomal protein L24 n=1 Tax=Camellia lanceoleosa TaxID=1840588 RepID=A0ACC0H9E1_9ERIC|nr:50S ribosomal protein L24 [Camellia lanceoleosa]
MCWRAAQKLIHHWKILRGDNVMVTRGKDRGGIGVVKHVIHSQNRLIVEGENQLPLNWKPFVWSLLTSGRPPEAAYLEIDTPMDLALEKTYDAKSGKGMPDPINLLFNFIRDI